MAGNSTHKNYYMTWGWLLTFLWMFLSLAGILYGLWLLFISVIFLVWAIIVHLQNRKSEIGYESLKRVWAWQRGEIPEPPEEDFRLAADSFMFSDWEDYRQEDMQTHHKYGVPERVRKYIKSEREIPRRF